MAPGRTTFDTAEEIIGWLVKGEVVSKSKGGSWPDEWRQWESVREAHKMMVSRFCNKLPTTPPAAWAGDGIVIMGGGRYWAATLVTVNMVRHVGCQLPIEVWHLRDEVTKKQAAMLADLGAVCRNLDEEAEESPRRIRGAWQWKPFAVLSSRFQRVLYLDADCYPVADPTVLFDCPLAAKRGAVFYPDGSNYNLPEHVWRLFNVAYQKDPPFESGQLWVDKAQCFRELLLTLHISDHSDYYYHWPSGEDPTRIIYGDKESWHFAWRILGKEWGMYRATPEVSPEAYIHCGPDGKTPLFVHRCKGKFGGGFTTTQGTLIRNPGLPLEDKAWEFFLELQKPQILKTRAPQTDRVMPPEGTVITKILMPSDDCFNPSMIEVDGKVVMAYRRGHWNAKVWITTLGPDWQVVGEPKVLLEGPVSYEDPRLFRFDGNVYVSYTEYDGKSCSIGLSPIFRSDWTANNRRVPKLVGRQHWEKNHAFFQYGWDSELPMLLAVYSIAPHQIIHVDGPDAYRVWQTSRAERCKYGEPRGGAPPILVGDEWFHFFHPVSYSAAGRVYGLGVYAFEDKPPFRITRWGKRPIMTAETTPGIGHVPGVIFPGGVIFRDNIFHISCGAHDSECWIVSVPFDAVEGLL